MCAYVCATHRGSEALRVGDAAALALRKPLQRVRRWALDAQTRMARGCGRGRQLVGHSAAACTRWLPTTPASWRSHAAPPASSSADLADDEMLVQHRLHDAGGPLRHRPAVRRHGIAHRRAAQRDTVHVRRQRSPIAIPARGIRDCARVDLADGGAESPKETELRLLLVRDGLPRPVTQIKWVSAASTWAGPNGRSASSTTASNTGPIPATTPTTSSDSNSLPHRAGPSCGSAHGSCDTTARESSRGSDARSLSTCRSPGPTSCRAGRPRPSAAAAAAARSAAP